MAAPAPGRRNPRVGCNGLVALLDGCLPALPQVGNSRLQLTQVRFRFSEGQGRGGPGKMRNRQFVDACQETVATGDRFQVVGRTRQCLVSVRAREVHRVEFAQTAQDRAFVPREDDRLQPPHGDRTKHGPCSAVSFVPG